MPSFDTVAELWDFIQYQLSDKNKYYQFNDEFVVSSDEELEQFAELVKLSKPQLEDMRKIKDDEHWHYYVVDKIVYRIRFYANQPIQEAPDFYENEDGYNGKPIKYYPCSYWIAFARPLQMSRQPQLSYKHPPFMPPLSEARDAPFWDLPGNMLPEVYSYIYSR